MSTSASGHTRRQFGMAALTLGALGVVFGDIGTSPLYALQTVFSARRPGGAADRRRRLRRDLARLLVDHDDRLDQVRDLHHARRQRRRGRHHGADRAGRSGRRCGADGRRSLLVALGIFGAALFYGDGDDHPGDLGAVGGRGAARSSTPSLADRWSCRSTLVVLVGLFAIQRFGTARGRQALRPGDGRLVRGARRRSGCRRSSRIPAILRALSPTYAVAFFVDHPASRSSRSARSCWRSPAPRRSTPTWATSAARRSAAPGSSLVFPALTLNYLGQGALILRRPRARSTNPFFLLLPALGADPDGACWRRSRPSSPRRRSSPARSR